MLIVFIDGPWEGKTLLENAPQREYRVPLYEPTVIERSKKDVTPMGQAIYREVHSWGLSSDKRVVLYSSEPEAGAAR
jgi:hypothetical protein